MKDFTQIIIRPLVTERASLDRALGKYYFAVAQQATKDQIKVAVEKLFNVQVTKINTSRGHGKSVKRWGKTIGYKSDWKKAIITLAAGEKIDLVEGMY